MDQGTQQNAAMVEQTTATTHGLANEALALFELISRFKLDTTAASHAEVLHKPAAETASRSIAPSPARVHRLTANAGGVSRGPVAAASAQSWKRILSQWTADLRLAGI